MPPAFSLFKFFPRATDFAGRFGQHAGLVVEGAQVLIELLARFDDPEQRALLMRRIDDIENAADDVNREVGTLLKDAFQTRFSRESIHLLMAEMDDVVDLMQATAQTMDLLNLHRTTPHMATLASLARDACLEIQAAVQRAPDGSDPQARADAVLAHCANVDRIESQADHALRVAMSELFRTEPDDRELIKQRAVYELLESITDKTKSVAKVLERFVLEET